MRGAEFYTGASDRIHDRGPVDDPRPHSLNGAASLEVTLRKRAARAGLEVAFEGKSSRFVDKFHGHDQLPRPPSRRVDAQAGVVRIQSLATFEVTPTYGRCGWFTVFNT